MSEADLNALRDDISFLKQLSSEGSARPAPGLWLMVVFGGAFGTSALAAYGLVLTAVATGDVGPARLAAYPFYASVTLFLGAIAVVGWKVLRPGDGAPPMSRAARAAWTAAFLGLVTVLASFKVFALTGRHQDYAPGYAEHLLPAILLALWGAAWWVAGFTSDRSWARLIGPTSFAAALAAALLANTVHILPVAGLSLLLLMAAPAIALLRESGRP